MSFTSGSWDQVAALYQQILAHPFNRELAAGTLSRERFIHYMIQDAHYLGMFSRALALTAAKAPSPDGQVALARSAHEAIVVERALHEGFFHDFGIGDAEWRATRPSPTCALYGHFLVSTAAVSDYAVALAALLPCFVIYWRVGTELHGSANRPNPYQRWIDTYADDSFAEAVRGVCTLADTAFDAAGEPIRTAMREAYRQSSALEWMFWDAAYRMESWPV